MELSIGTQVLGIMSLEHGLCFLILSLKKPRLPLAVMRMIWRAWGSWGIHISIMLPPLARAVCHIHVPNQQHKPTLSFSQDGWTTSQISPVPCIMTVSHQVQTPAGKRHSSAHGHLQIPNEAVKGNELISSLKISHDLLQKRLEIPKSSTLSMINEYNPVFQFPYENYRIKGRGFLVFFFPFSLHNSNSLTLGSEAQTDFIHCFHLLYSSSHFKYVRFTSHKNAWK